MEYPSYSSQWRPRVSRASCFSGSCEEAPWEESPAADHPHILVVDDDPALVFVLRDALAVAGYESESAADGSQAVMKAATRQFALILLDVRLPEQDGLSVCQRLREAGVDTPVIMMTGVTDCSERVRGLRIGADDCLTKPFDVHELLARIQALLRRNRVPAEDMPSECRVGRTVVDLVHGTATRDGLRESLSGKELHLLRYLVKHRGCVVSRKQLLSTVWGYRTYNTRTLDMHIATIRRKLEQFPHRPQHILTARGQGYLFHE